MKRPPKPTPALSRPRDTLSNSVRVMVSLEVETLQSIDEAAAEAGITRGAWMRQVLREALQQR